MNIQLLLTGNELMSGHTVDSNSAMIAHKLSAYGFVIDRKITIGDSLIQLITEIEQISTQADLLIINGGLGPTSDDLTAEALAKVIDKPLITHPQAAAHVEHWCRERGFNANASNMKQALLPASVTLVHNPIGSAVGFACNHNQCLIICTPGVPSELSAMLSSSITQLLTSHFPAVEKKYTRRLQTFGIGESSLQEIVNTHSDRWPPAVELGFRAGMPQLEIKLTIASEQDNSALESCYALLVAAMGDCIIGEEDATLASTVVNLLETAQQTITTAESCTGGMIASQLTQVAGASAVFHAGFVTYSNAMKSSMLGVANNTIDRYGAVSEQVVMAMASGALSNSNADYAIAVSGIAGPDGGTDEKPVGTVWIAWGSKATLRAKRLQLSASRSWFQQMVSAIGLDLIRRELQGIDREPIYFKRFGK